MILVAGCSYCDQYHNDYPVWPYLLGTDVINIARSGYSNIQINNSLHTHFLTNDNKVDFCIVSWTQWNRKQFKTYHMDHFDDIIELVKANIQSMIQTNELLQSINVPFISFQMLPPFPKYTKQILEEVSKYSNLCIGYPGMEELGGYNLLYKLQLIENKLLREDNHPNKEGNELIADTVYKYIKYGNTCLPSTKIKS